MSGTAVYLSVCVFISLQPIFLYLIFKEPFEIWLRRVIEEEVSAVMGEDFAERERG